MKWGELQLSQFIDWPKRERRFAIGCLFIFVQLLLLLAYSYPQYQRYKQTSLSNQKLQAKAATVSLVQMQHQQLQQQMEQELTRYLALRQPFKDNIEASDILNQITHQAQMGKVNLIQMEWRDELFSNGVASRPFTLQLTGYYADLVVFITRLTLKYPTLYFQNMQFIALQNQAKIKVNLSNKDPQLLNVKLQGIYSQMEPHLQWLTAKLAPKSVDKFADPTAAVSSGSVFPISDHLPKSLFTFNTISDIQSPFYLVNDDELVMPIASLHCNSLDKAQQQQYQQALASLKLKGFLGGDHKVALIQLADNKLVAKRVGEDLTKWHRITAINENSLELAISAVDCPMPHKAVLPLAWLPIDKDGA